MSRTSRRLNRAIRITPAADRQRYVPEWWGDAQAASELGLAASDVARGASHVAWRLRLRHTQRALAGEEGLPRALAGWASVALVLPMAFVLGGPLLLVAVPVAMLSPLLFVFRSRWRTGIVVMTGSAALWVGCSIAFWWLWGIGFDAIDAGQPEPRITVWSAPSFLTGLMAILAFWATFAVGLLRGWMTRSGSASGPASGPVAGAVAGQDRA